jgi:hypothetical protein
MRLAAPADRRAAMDADAARSVPRMVLLFSGHRVDAPGRSPARFPAAKIASATLAIEAALDALQPGPDDLALTQGSAGGDLIFAEGCIRRRVPLRLLLPVDEARFIDQSVRASADGKRWVERYRTVRSAVSDPPRVVAEPPRQAGASRDRFELCNRWLLETALAYGAERVRLICLWDGQPGGGPGGTADLVAEARRRDLPITWLDARRL